MILQTYLAEVSVKTRFNVTNVKPNILKRQIGFYRNLPLTGVDRPKEEFPVDIRHFDRIFPLDGPYPICAISRVHPKVEGRSLQQFYCMNTGDTYYDQNKLHHCVSHTGSNFFVIH